MHKTIAILCLWLGLMLAGLARSEVIFLSDRVIDTRTQLAWLNVWEGDALVNPHRLADVAGRWPHRQLHHETQ